MWLCQFQFIVRDRFFYTILTRIMYSFLARHLAPQFLFYLWIDVRPACGYSFFYLSHGLVRVCEIELSHMGKNNGNSYLVCEKIRNHHECEGGLEKSIPMITDWHHEACQVMTNGDPEGQIFFLSHPHTNNEFFLSCSSLNNSFYIEKKNIKKTSRKSSIRRRNFNITRTSRIDVRPACGDVRLFVFNQPEPKVSFCDRSSPVVHRPSIHRQLTFSYNNISS